MDQVAPLASKAKHVSLLPTGFGDIVGWRDDDHAAAFRAFLIGAPRIAKTLPKTRGLGIDGAALRDIACAALRMPANLGASAARAFFETHFRPLRIGARGFVTGYYEPEVEAARERSAKFSVPLYRCPSDLVEVSDRRRPAEWDPEMRFGMTTADGLAPFYDRAAIEDGALAGRGLELAWLEDPVDAFFIHVQGSARLRISDGGAMRIAFDGKSGHRYTSIARLAVERGILTREAADKAGLEAWLEGNPEAGRALMRENRSFIFFRETGQDEADGPIGAAGVPLSPGRSLAIDRTLHTFHTPVWVEALDLPDPNRAGEEFRRLMIAQDTGSAIVGPARGDIFYGSGEAAGVSAGRVRHAAAMIVLAPVGGAAGL
ncbi:MAG TPA: MltA domain-containing protein [Propylenella sp.]